MTPGHTYRPVRFFLATAVATWILWSIGARKGMEAYAPLLSLVGLLAPPRREPGRPARRRPDSGPPCTTGAASAGRRVFLQPN